ncbi:MAG: monovalent cation/H+ antiporter complex subunit F [Actinomycetota bacterium]
MTQVAFLILALSALLFAGRLVVGPSVADRVVATDGLLVTVMGGVLLAAVDQGTALEIDTVLVVALLGFVATGVLARYIEQRGGR